MSDLARNSNDIESLTIKIINKKTKNVVISARYRQPASDFKQYKIYLENFFNKIKNSDKAIYTQITDLILIDYEMNVKVKNYLKLSFQKNFIPFINKWTRVSRNNATIIDCINKNHFLNNDMYSGIITADISDYFPFISNFKRLDAGF